MGWLWFLVMLVPVIGLVQISVQSIADRYTYLPAVGCFLAATWGLTRWVQQSGRLRMVLIGGLGLILLAGCWQTRIQLAYWRSSVALFEHALQVTGDNPIGMLYLANSLKAAGEVERAKDYYRRILQRAPDSEDVHYRLAFILKDQHRWAEAQAEWSEVLRIHPDNPYAMKYLGDAFAAQRNFSDAARVYADAQRYLPEDPVIAQAIDQNDRQLALQAQLDALAKATNTSLSAAVLGQMGLLNVMLENYPEAVRRYEAALGVDPNAPEVLNNYAWLLATCSDAAVRKGERAVTLAATACRLTRYQAPIYLGTLAAAYAEAGRFDEAIATANQACALAGQLGETNLVARNRELLTEYQNHRPHRE
jgi:tetratricopeptide (TPR) repeat protein